MMVVVVVVVVVMMIMMYIGHTDKPHNNQQPRGALLPST
jgi:uncharacterized membrane protein